MEIVSMDFFTVLAESREAFRKQSRIIQGFIRTLPGFVDGYFYEKKDGISEYNYVTTAVWRNQEAFESAGKSISSEFQRIGFNPQEFFTKLNVKRIRSEYDRQAY